MSTQIDSWENRIEQTAKILGLEENKVETILADYGVKKAPCGLEMLSDESVTPFGDLRKEFCEKNNISLPLLRMAMKILRGPSTATKTDSVDTDLLELKSRYGVETKMEDLNVEQLLPFYNPKKKNQIHTILIERYGNQPLIAFKPDTEIVAQEETINYICDLEAGYGAEKYVSVDGELVNLHPVGQVPNQMVSEDPLFAGQPLKRERSIVNRVNWTNVLIEERKFFRILVERNDINPNDRVNMSKLVEKTINDLKEIFPEAYLEYKERKTKGTLPRLEISLQDISKTTTKTQDPFSVGKYVSTNRKW